MAAWQPLFMSAFFSEVSHRNRSRAGIQHFLSACHLSLFINTKTHNCRHRQSHKKQKSVFGLCPPLKSECTSGIYYLIHRIPAASLQAIAGLDRTSLKSGCSFSSRVKPACVLAFPKVYNIRQSSIFTCETIKHQELKHSLINLFAAK